MAGVAFLTIAAFVNVIGPVAGNAGHIDLLRRSRTLVARAALDLGVPSAQGKARLLVVIETDRRPLCRRMAICAELAIRSLVLVIQLVAGEAVLGCPAIAFIRVAALATDARMRTRQRKRRLLMVEGNCFPGRLVVAALAAGAKPALVPVVIRVTRGTTRWSLRIFLASLVARTAGQATVRALQRIVREGVVEVFRVERGEIGIPALVLLVALAAGHGPHERIPAVISGMLDDLAVNRLVAVPTTRGLPLLVERDVAVLAVVSKLLVLFAQFAG